MVQQKCDGGTLGAVKEKEKRRKKEECGKPRTIATMVTMVVVVVSLPR